MGRKTYKKALTVVDIASRYKETEALTDKSSAKVAAATTQIYKRGPLTWPNSMQIDPGCEFMGTFSQLLIKRNVKVRRGSRSNTLTSRYSREIQLDTYQEDIQTSICTRTFVESIRMVRA